MMKMSLTSVVIKLLVRNNGAIIRKSAKAAKRYFYPYLQRCQLEKFKKENS
jgi:hypothetical protein